MLKYISMNISVIIPTLNAGDAIKNLITMIQSQDITPIDIIVVDSSSDDHTVDIAKSMGVETMVISRDAFNHGKTRNIAALRSKGDVLIFMTQDAVPFDNNLIRRLTAPLSLPEVAASYGRHIPREDASPLEVFSRKFNYPDKGYIKGFQDIKKYGIKTFFFSNVCSAIKKELFIKTGMFPEGIKTNEDMLLCARLIINGYKIAYVPEAMVIHSHNFSLKQQFKRYYNIGLTLKQNRWILEYAAAESEGITLIKEQFNFIIKNHKYRWIPYILLESVTKYTGYKMGFISAWRK
ncbi:MAG: glycosyltransferase [Nitrospirae bacterium]|nr:glycosyltransferase [Nitrospirota bacterium]